MIKIYCFLALLLLASASGIAQGAGISTHMFMADLAIQQTSDSGLKTFLLRMKNSIRNGSIFPDSGFVLKSTYGEIAHWDEFHNAFATYLDRNCELPLTPKCEDLFAFYLGSLAHGLGDAHFDRYFLQPLAQLDFSGSLDEAGKYTDTGLDMLAIIDYNLFRKVPEKWIPGLDLKAVFLSIGVSVRAVDLFYRSNAVFAGLLLERASAPLFYLYYKNRSAWASQNYYHARGGVLDSALVIQSVWTQIWKALHQSGRFRDIARLKKSGTWPNFDFWFEE